MGHAIEQFEDGTAAFVSGNRQAAWHRLGTVTEGALTAEEALRLAHMDWHVYKTDQPVQMTALTDDGVSTVDVDGKFATYRLHPKTGQPEALGVVGTQYQPIQNAEAFDFLSLLVDEHGAVFETAGSLHGGKRVFVTMKMPKDIKVGGQDLVESYLLATNSHDGTGAFTVAVTPIRVVCQNTLTLALSRQQRTMSIRHTSGATGRVQAARDTLGLTFAYMDEFEAAAEKLISQKFTDKQFTNLVNGLVREPKEGSKRSATNVENVKRDLMGLWRADTQANVAGTKWAAYNAVTEYVDWFKPVKGKDKDARRAYRVMDGATESLKNRAFAALTK